MLGHIVKVSIACLAIGYLIYTGKLDADKMKIIYQNPLMIAFIFSLSFIVIFPLAAYRFKLMLIPFKIAVPFTRSLSLTMIGNFFNNTLPGAVSGDVVKGYYLHKASASITKTDITAIIIMDRVVGLIGLIAVGMSGLILGNAYHIALPAIIASILYILFFGSVCFYGLIFINLKNPLNALFFKTAVKNQGIRATTRDIIEKFHVYHKHKPVLLLTLVLSYVIHLTTILVFFLISQHFLDDRMHIIRQAVVIPPGMITVALPVSPAGIGVGHAGFEALYNAVGLKDGANIFNIYIILQIAANLTGVIPYFYQGRQTKK